MRRVTIFIYIIRIKSRDNEMTEWKDIQSQYKVKISDNASVSHKQILARTKITISATQEPPLAFSQCVQECICTYRRTWMQKPQIDHNFLAL